MGIGLGAMLLIGGGLATAGWQEPVIQGDQKAPGEIQESIRVRRLEVVDRQGVPMVQLGTGRDGEGGSITLRDRLGERRAWWTSSPDGSNLALTFQANDDAGVASAGLGVSSGGSELNLIGSGGAMLGATVRSDQPRIDLWRANGETIFGAPFGGSGRRPQG